MLGRPPTTLQLNKDDISELVKELEERKLKLKIEANRRKLQVSVQQAPLKKSNSAMGSTSLNETITDINIMKENGIELKAMMNSSIDASHQVTVTPRVTTHPTIDDGSDNPFYKREL
ncbi:anaphase promoting complex subunit CDC26 NDAI_0G01980 [Naumovozyma dairenensis CBS 421]|uniref:Uncharacterized protein n=1 Tax=Naumovozyma dairenensis (strain ATCC 10597 / BCRC 20456 / CBS 421 / NBRC 0211 / NRRL Y-12639) TaxID=1071378 RepID=G0WDW2_NAUDC|nr:hypothetical protein NDAI_0G01980 [Naumovozyma dairenensis CBS 421]CCD25973.2 hypothetical protein NDAI_0G01980 [Naumovozyma dairenensis CBS 421]